MPLAATVAYPSNKQLTVIFAFASRKTTEFAPLDAVTPVPPLATAKVPAKVIAPDVALFGVKPVDPAENVLTKLPDKADVGMVVDAVTALVSFPYK